VGFVVGGGLAWQYRGQLREAVSEIRVAVAKLDTERRAKEEAEEEAERERRAREEAEKEAERERQRAERAEEEARQGAAEARRNEEEARRAAAEARRVAEEARQERQRAQETEEEARQQRERAEKAEREANEQKAMVEAFEATNEYLTKARSLHNEAKRLRLDGQKKEANERFQEAIYYYKQYKDSTRRIGKNELKSLYAEWLTPDNKPLPQAEALPIIRVQARSDDLEELLGLAEVLPSLWQDRQTEALRLVYDECLAEGASRTFLQAISETESNVLSRLF
jgi:DNA repair exonuclease SbcCD ATPase subunit